MMAENEKEQEKQESMTANELHVGTMSVDTLKANVYMDLADLTASLEQQGKEQLRALMRLNGKKNTADGKKETGQTYTGNGINTDNKKPNSNHSKKQEITNNGKKNTTNGIDSGVNGIDTVNSRSSNLQQVESKRRITVINNLNDTVNGKKKTVQAKPVDEAIEAKPVAYDPAQARKKRTIEVGLPAPQPAPPAQAAASQPAEIPPVQDAKNNGYYVDANGRLRRPDGKFASKIEVKRYNRERNQDVDEKNAAKNGSTGSANQLGLMAKAFAKLTGRAAQTDAADAAGVTAGGSYWLAAKEISDIASNFKESLRLRKINSMKDAKNYAKDKASRVGSIVTAPVRAGKRLVDRITGKQTPDETVKTKSAATKTSAIPVNSSKAAYESGVKEKADEARADKQLDVVKANHTETQQVLEEILDELKPKKAGLIDTLSSGKKMLDMVRGRGGKRAASRTKRGKLNRSKAGGISTAEGVLSDLSDDVQGIDINSGEQREKAKGKAGKEGKVKGSREVRTKARKVPKMGGKTGVAKRPVGLISKVLGAIPDAMSAIPSVATAAGVTSGKIMPVMETAGKGMAKAGKGVAAVGKGALELTGKGMLAGARALPLVGQALSVGLAGYDAYNGYNDTEAQKGIFNLKDGQAANTLQKSSTAAANVLDMGGLTSGLSGLLGDLAGFAGLKNTQEALTFDSGNMAKTMYDSVTGQSARKAMGVKDGQDMTLGQNIASGAASVLDMGGLTSFLSKGIGSLVEDLGVKGAKDAMTIDAGGMAKSMYQPFSDNGAIGGVIKTVSDFSSDSIVGAIDDLIKVIRNDDSSNSTSVTNFTPVSNWSGTNNGPARKAIQFPLKLSEMGDEAQLPEGYLAAVAGVESHGDPNARNKSGASGMWQFMPKTIAGMGGFNPFDPEASTKKMIEFTQKNADYFKQSTGRDATGRELYLLHQQGMGGGTKLLKNPNALASSIVGADAVTQNGGNLNMTAAQFSDHVMKMYDRQYAANKTAAPMKIGADTNGVKGVPPMLARPDAIAATNTIPTMLQRLQPAPIDIQKAKESKDGSASDAQKEPLVAKLDPAMSKSLSNIESLLKQQANASSASSDSGRQSSGRNSSVSDHDYVSGHMSDLVRDRG